MRLVADRFVMKDGEVALDLATRRLVSIAIVDDRAAGQERWAIRCDELLRLRHHAIAPLVDFGPIGPSHRFEAWSSGGTWRGAIEHASRSIAAASTFLHAIALSTGGASAYRVVHGDVGAATILPADAGYPSPVAVDRSAIADCIPGVVMIDRPAIAALSELFVAVDDREPRVAVLWGPSGSGLDTAVSMLARAARMHGFVPVDSRCLDANRRLFPDRSLFIIERRDRSRPTSWLDATLRTSRPHVCLLVGPDELRGVDGLSLTRVTSEALVDAVRPVPRAAAVRRRLEREAERAAGLPGRFVRALWPAPLVNRRRRFVTLARVAEQAATYGEEPSSDALAASDDFEAAAAPVGNWPSPGELARLRRQIESANALLSAGRHAPGLRLLRQTIGGLARRDAWADAAGAGLMLAAHLLARGRPRDALRALDRARGHADRCGDADMLLDVAIAAGDAWTDLARLVDAERVFRTALASARAADDRWRASLVVTGLARTLFWRGAYGDAAAMLGADAIPSNTAAAVRRLRLAARVAIAQGASAAAMEALAEARARATGHDGDRLLVDVEHTEAFVKLAIGDLDGAEPHAASCVGAARRARRPLRALSARLMQLEADRRRERYSVAGALESLRRLVSAAPPLIKARWDVLKALVDHAGDPDAVEQRVKGTGLEALALFVRPAVDKPTRSDADPFVHEILEILRICQHADDEIALLKDVCARVRGHLRAAAAAFIVVADGRRESIAVDGPRMEAEIAERAIALGLTIAPHRVRERLEAASAVLYGGAAIGALCARWTIGATVDLSRAPAVLSMAATAAAPVLSALLTRRSHPRPPALFDLLGATTVMSDLRRAVERAGAAPFAVLVEGESGSGKELVARAIHRCSARRDRPFCTVNCAALPDDLVEAELFGHARGAFTGAVADRPGVFEEAHGGTLFLDEIGELSARAQAKILRVIQEGEIRRVGENAARRIDVRIVSATNRDLRREVEQGRFRIDLLYRLDVIRIAVPPLRDRREDIPLLADHVWGDATRRIGSHATLATATRTALAAYDWPGNVRELQNVLAALAVRCPKHGVVPPSALPAHIAATARVPATWRLDSARRTFEEAFVRAALVRSGGHRGRAAADLGVTRQGLTKLLTRLGIGE